jgi:hypothetical protein
MAAFKHRAMSFGTPEVPPTDVASSTGSISLHNAIEATSEITPTKHFVNKGRPRD